MAPRFSGANAKQNTSQAREALTGETGDFAFTLLPPGHYKLEVIAGGFKTRLVAPVWTR